MREIGHILNFRGDISPFLVHLTRKANEEHSAREVLRRILEERQLVPSCSPISDARFGKYTANMDDESKCRYFGAVCFTETPLNEVHCMLEIKYRQMNLEPYGLVFLKDRIRTRGVGPVLYLNNELRDQDDVIRALCGLIDTHEEIATRILPMISVFGYYLTAPGAEPQDKKVNFIWEREWRLPSVRGPFKFDADDVFVGLCPHSEIEEFDNLFKPVGFIDPTRNMKWYATKLIEARQRLDLKASVV